MKFGFGAATAAGCILGGLGGISAQECTASTATGFDYQVGTSSVYGVRVFFFFVGDRSLFSFG